MTTINSNSVLEESDKLHSSEVTLTSDAQRENGLATAIVDEIYNGGLHDMIVVGHGNSIRDTLTTFFPNYKAKHREDDALDFAESQNLMAFEANGKKQLFMLPFRIQVDQHTPGKMNVRAVPYAELTPDYQDVADEVNLKDLELPTHEAEDILESYEMMFGTGGLTLSKTPPKKKEGAPELVINTEDDPVEKQDTENEHTKVKNKD